jgi:nitroreductase
VCPTKAIMHEDFPNDHSHQIKRELIPDYNSLNELFKARRSIRNFISKPVDKELIKKAINGAQFSPSTNNLQTTKYIVVQNKQTIDKIREYTTDYINKILKYFKNPILRKTYLLFTQNDPENIKNMVRDYKVIVSNINDGNDLILHNPAALVFFYADKKIGFSDVNAALALQNTTLAFFSIGLGSFYAGYVVAAAKRNENILKILKLSKGYEIYGCLAIGYSKLRYDRWIERKKPDIIWY